MKKKALKIIGIFMVALLALLIAVPFFLEGKIADIIKNKVNNNINATLDFREAKLSLIKSFPNAHVSLKDISLVNRAPFEGDTLFAAGDVALSMSVKELFKTAEEPLVIKRFQVDRAQLNIRVDREENANYDIALKDGEDEEGEAVADQAMAQDQFSLSMDSYAITDSRITYEDLSSGMRLHLLEMNHSGAGDLSLEQSQLKTLTDALVSFEMDSTLYLDRHKVSLDALIGIDLVENRYSFLENRALVNQLPLVFDGYVQLNEDNQEVDITFKTPSSDFRNFLALIPEAYSKNIESVETSGNFEVAGQFKGIVDEDHIPTFNIKINSDNASFKYPDLPKTVNNVFIDVEVDNSTGIVEDTSVDIERLSFTIDRDRFNLSSKIRDLMGNTKVDLKADGKIDLSNISQAYPLEGDLDLKGMLDADVSAKFDMESLEKKQYENTNLAGHLLLTGFEYASPELKHPVVLDRADLGFNPGKVSLNSLQGKMGSTDFNASGTLDNLLGFMFNNETVQGNFKLSSEQFNLNDLMVEDTGVAQGEGEAAPEEAPAPSGEERIKIPSFLDCRVEAVANTVLYDNLKLRNVKGTLIIKDETAELQNLTSDLFGGTLGLSGSVSTKGTDSTFDLDLGMHNFNIRDSFEGLELFKVLTPLATALEGKLNSDINISGLLKDDFTPNLATISGNLLAELLSTSVNTEKTPLIAALDSKLNFLDSKQIDLDGLKTALSFDNGSVRVKPFTLNYKDIAINVDGSHGFDRQMDYTATLEVPAKYLGSEVSNLIAQMNDQSLAEVTVPVTASIGGNFSSPSVSTNLASSVKTLTSRLVEVQKQKLMDQGKDKAKDLLSDLLKKDGSDSTTTSTQGGVKEALGTLLGGDDKTTPDSTKSSVQDQGKEAAKSILGGLLGKKKKDTVD